MKIKINVKDYLDCGCMDTYEVKSIYVNEEGCILDYSNNVVDVFADELTTIHERIGISYEINSECEDEHFWSSETFEIVTKNGKSYVCKNTPDLRNSIFNGIDDDLLIEYEK